MNQFEPYPRIARWIVPAAALHATLRGVCPAGLRATESGAFWLGHRGATAQVAVVVFPRGKGVLEQSDMWQVSPEVFGAMSRWAFAREVVMLGMFHIHIGHSAELSRWDRERVVQVPDMLSIIAADAGVRSDHQSWSWYVFEDDGYREMESDERSHRITVDHHRSCTTWIADASSVQECQL